MIDSDDRTSHEERHEMIATLEKQMNENSLYDMRKLERFDLSMVNREIYVYEVEKVE